MKKIMPRFNRITGSLALALTLVAFSKSSGHASDLGAAVHPADDPSHGAPSHPFFDHRLLIQGGVSFNAMRSGAAVGSASAQTGLPLSFEHDLGLAKHQQALELMLRYRLSDRWMFEGSFFSLPRANAINYARTIDFGKYSFDATFGLNTDLKIGSYRLGVGYSFLRSSNVEIGAAFSLFVSDFSAALGGSASIGSVSAGFQTERYQVLAPLPALGVYAHYALTPRWLVSGRADFLEVTIPSIKMLGLDLRNAGGRVINVEASTEYRVFENLGIGIGYRYLDIALGATTSGLTGIAGYSVHAPTAFVRMSF